MSESIIANLKAVLNDLSSYGSLPAETRRNALKEELQYYVLNFIYHDPEYRSWIMYGGTALRIIHRLNRMSVDLDFEVAHEVTAAFLEELKRDIEKHFADRYGTLSDFLTVKIVSGRGVLLKFHLGDELSSGEPSKQVHVKIDLNHFADAATVTERHPISRGQLAFVIVTYNLSSLMASKIAAIFLRGTRGTPVGTFEEKGRDIYDLLWYMEKGVVPDLDYLVAKKIDVKDVRGLFDALTIRMNKVSDENLKQDLTPLFVNESSIFDWLAHWRETYLRLLRDYNFRTVRDVRRIEIYQDFNTDRFLFVYEYDTIEGRSVRITYQLSDYWLDYAERDLAVDVDAALESKIVRASNGASSRPASEKMLRQYATMFHRKNEAYFKKTNRTMIGDVVTTKVIRMTADNLNPKEQIVLTASALKSCALDDLFK